MPNLTLEQQTEMVEKMRSERGAGRPEIAAQIQKSLDRDEFYLGKLTVVSKAPEPPTRQAKTDAWAEWAKEVSNIDHEVLDNAKRKDIIGMLEANGILDRQTEDGDE